MNKVCTVCGIEFDTVSAHKYTCSRGCYKKHWEKYRQSDETKAKREIWKLNSARYGKLKKRVKEKGFTYIMPEDKYFEIIKGDCYYCGKNMYGIEKGVGLDRLDNDEEYLESNVVSCCKVCNMGRGDAFTSDVFKGMMNNEKYIRALSIMNDAQKTKRTLEEFVDAILAKSSSNDPNN